MSINLNCEIELIEESQMITIMGEKKSQAVQDIKNIIRHAVQPKLVIDNKLDFPMPDFNPSKAAYISEGDSLIDLVPLKTMHLVINEKIGTFLNKYIKKIVGD